MTRTSKLARKIHGRVGLHDGAQIFGTRVLTETDLDKQASGKLPEVSTTPGSSPLEKLLQDREVFDKDNSVFTDDLITRFALGLQVVSYPFFADRLTDVTLTQSDLKTVYIP